MALPFTMSLLNWIAGQIIRQEQINIEPNDDENTLMERIKKIENLIYPEEISKLKI